MIQSIAEVRALEARGETRRTPCGAGQMIWHIWGEGPPLVLLHGGYGSWTHWVRSVEHFSRHYRVLAADLPGLGDSAAAPDPYTADSIAAIVTEGLASLVRPNDTIDLAGFSFGGLIGGHVTERLGERMKHLVLVGSGGTGIPRPTPVELVKWHLRVGAAAQREAHRENLAILMMADPANIDTLAIDLQVENAARARTKSRPLSRNPTLLKALPKIKAKLSGIWGERDITAHGIMEETRKLLQSFQPEARFTVVPAAGHWVAYEAADAFNAALLRHLRD
ncbi:MAG TPA: alpha/beta hydrolase [Stellaceae bacterium]|nr:alpha/beta hydrolase [Stellaceae bacterium]